MLTNYPHFNLNELDQFTVEQCEEALLYLRYYQSRLHAGPEKKELSGFIAAIENRLRESNPGLGEMMA